MAEPGWASSPRSYASLFRDARLLCVEPHPASAATLRRRGFEVVEAALWSADGDVLLTQPEAAATSCTAVGSRRAAARRSWRVGPSGSTGSGSRADASS